MAEQKNPLEVCKHAARYNEFGYKKYLLGVLKRYFTTEDAKFNLPPKSVNNSSVCICRHISCIFFPVVCIFYMGINRV